MDLEHERRLADVENRAKSNTRRLDKLEEQTEAINNLTMAVQVMATKQDGMAEEIIDLCVSVKEIKEKPAKRAEAIAEKIILVLVGALVGVVLTHFGL